MFQSPLTCGLDKIQEDKKEESEKEETKTTLKFSFSQKGECIMYTYSHIYSYKFTI